MPGPSTTASKYSSSGLLGSPRTAARAPASSGSPYAKRRPERIVPRVASASLTVSNMVGSLVTRPAGFEAVDLSRRFRRAANCTHRWLALLRLYGLEVRVLCGEPHATETPL